MEHQIPKKTTASAHPVLEPDGQEKAAAFSPSPGISDAATQAPASFLVTATAPIQTKLTLGGENDGLEQEAEQVAGQVVSRIQRAATRPEDEEKVVRRAPLQFPQFKLSAEKPAPEISPDTQDQIDHARGSGTPLPLTAQNQMEGAFGADFSAVRIHTDAQADQLSRSLDARAFATGSDIFFRNGAFRPEAESGQHLLAHELTHVVQQNSNLVSRKVIQRDPVTEEDVRAQTGAAWQQYGLEEGDIRSRGRGGLHATDPHGTAELINTLDNPEVHNNITETLNIFRSYADDLNTSTQEDLPFVLSLGFRESGGSIFRTDAARVVTAGRDTHRQGVSGLDFFYNRTSRAAFEHRGQTMSRVSTGLVAGRENRTPAFIEARRLLLAFMVKTASDELVFRRHVAREMEHQGRSPGEAESLTGSLSTGALRAWKALYFAGPGYGLSAVRHILRTQQQNGTPFSLEDILSINHAPGVDNARLRRARGVALRAQVIERLVTMSEFEPVPDMDFTTDPGG